MNGTGRIALGALVVLVSLHASAKTAAADCTAVIALSKVSSSTIQGSDQVEQYARDFCKEYSASSFSSASMELSVSYKFLAGSFGSSSASGQEVASRYCDATDSSKKKAESYRQYVDAIAPGAYESYQRCVELENKVKLVISTDLNAVLPSQIVINVSNNSDSQKDTQTLRYWASSGVDCKWMSSGKTGEVSLPVNGQDALACERSNSKQKSSVQIYATTRRDARVSFSWDSYTNGVPDNYLASLAASAAEAARLTKALKGAAIPFNRKTCPSGWHPYAAAYGRFVRGVDPTGKIDPDGARAAGSVQEDQFRSHNHSRPHDVYDAGKIEVGSVKGGADLGYDFARNGGSPVPPTGDNGGAETRPKNVAMLYCSIDE